MPSRRPGAIAFVWPLAQLLRKLFSDILQDVRYTVRSLRKARGFAIVAVISLAVGIGVNTSMFTAIHSVLLAPVPGVTGEDRIVDMVPVIRGHESFWWAYPDFESVRDANTPFQFLTAWAERDATLGAEDGSSRIRMAYATSEYFYVLGALPAMGRGFLDSEDRGAGQHPVAVVSHDFWQDQLTGRSDVLDQSLILDGIPYTVVGVAPEDFIGARVNQSGVDVWVPLFQHPDAGGDASVFSDREQLTVQVLGRLGPGATLSEARAAVQTVFAGLATEYPETNKDRTVKAVSYGRFPAQNRIYDVIAVVGVAGLLAVLLLIICGNLAGMALARSATREHEIAVRLALGSSRLRLVRQLMVEAVVLSLVGGGVGILLAMTLMTRVSPMDLGISAPGATFAPSGWTLAMSLILSLVAAQAFGLLPALRFSRPELVSALKDDTGGGGGRRVGRFQRYAAAFQTGAAFLLLLIAALFLRSLQQTDESQIGFRPEGMVVTDFRTGGPFLARLDIAEEGYPSMEEGGSALVNEVMEAVGSLPGVASVAVADGFPLDRRRAYLSVASVDRLGSDDTGVRVEYTQVTEDYFSTIGTPVLQGRALLRTDDATAPRVAVVTRSFAERLWPGADALGQQFYRVGAEDAMTWTVVGVVADVASSSVTEDWPHAFLPLRQSADPDIVVLVRADSDPSSLAGPVREAMRSVDPGLPSPLLLPAPYLVARATQEQRTSGQIAGGLGLLVLLLSAMGVHGVVAFAVTNRTREIGLRIALGASRKTVILDVLGDALRMVGPGLLAGGLLAVGTAAALRSMLLGLSPVDPVSFLSAGALLLFMVIAAGLAPALRASGIAPMEALRRD
jgi:predicted permease